MSWNSFLDEFYLHRCYKLLNYNNRSYNGWIAKETFTKVLIYSFIIKWYIIFTNRLVFTIQKGT